MRYGNDAKVTAKEIGRHLGLSQPTVSRILSGAEGHRVSPETRRRVTETAQQMGYRPNALARSLRQGRTNLVGFYTGYGYLDARNPFQVELIGSLQRAADKVRLDILLHGVFRGASTDDIFGELVNGRIDGLFINTSAGDPLVARLQSASLPVVAIADTVPSIASVVADDAGGTRILLNFLWERGHRRIAYLRPESFYSSVARRVETFNAWAGEKGLPFAQAPVYQIPHEFTETALDTILALPPDLRPTAVCCWNDVAAFDLLMHCKKRGVSVPGDLAVAGFDGLLTDPRLRPRALVTMGASWGKITECAVALLTHQINRRGEKDAHFYDDEGGVPLLTHFPATLIAGDTV